MLRDKKRGNLVPSEARNDGAERAQLPRYLAYALLRCKGDNTEEVLQYQDMELHDVLLDSQHSFLDFEGIVLFAGTFEKTGTDRYIGDSRVVCRALTELDQRERQFFTAIKQNKFIIFLVPDIPETISYNTVDSKVDLFRRVLTRMGIRWERLRSSVAYAKSLVPEFHGFIEQYGTAYVHYGWQNSQKDIVRPICGSENETYGLCIAGKIFVLPYAFPQTHEQAVQMAVEAIRAGCSYRERVKKELPEWIAEYRFSKEKKLISKAEAIQAEYLQVESQIDDYRQYKGGLCFRSDPLVQVTAAILHDFFEMDLEIDDKCIEDAVLRDQQDKIIAVFEIKGVNGSFTRKDVNQVDSHRERLSLPVTTPGILIMNTNMTAASLSDKDQFPHPDIIKKAVMENILLIRTLDLLRYADAVDRGVLTADSFKQMILSESGWLKVENDTAQIVKE